MGGPSVRDCKRVSRDVFCDMFEAMFAWVLSRARSHGLHRIVSLRLLLSLLILIVITS